MSDGFLIFASQVSIMFSVALLTIIYGSVAVLQILAYGYGKLSGLFHTGIKFSQTTISNMQKNEPAVSSKTTMMGA